MHASKTEYPPAAGAISVNAGSKDKDVKKGAVAIEKCDKDNKDCKKDAKKEEKKDEAADEETVEKKEEKKEEKADEEKK